jgi:hypothetical protein
LAPLFGFTQPIHLHQRAIFFYSLGAVLLGAQFMSIGFLAALVTATQRRHTDSYSVVERAGGGALWRKVGDGGRGARGVEQDNIGDYARGEQSCAPSRSSESSPRKA